MPLDAEAPRRPTTIAEYDQAWKRMESPEDDAAGLAAYRPRPTDVVITPYSKCGTTWLQQTFHTLRTRGDMDFDDISRVVPWIETSGFLGIDIEAPQRAEPRGFKSHLAYDELPKGARYVVSFRDPMDAMASIYRFMEGWFFEPGSISIGDFAAFRLNRADAPSSYWNHLISWWSQRNNPNVLLFSYEGMIARPEQTIRRLAAFAEIPLDDELLALTLERSSFAYMHAHKEHFSEALMCEASETHAGLPPGSDAAKVRKGAVGDHHGDLTPEVVEALNDVWARIVTPALGFKDYAALEAELNGRSA